MRVAQKQQLYARFFHFTFQVVKVDMVGTVLVYQRIGDNAAPVVRMDEKKQLYTGVCTTTPSPGSVRA